MTTTTLNGITYRPATQAEINERVERDLRTKRLCNKRQAIRFEHHVIERYNPNAKNGVSHVRVSNRKPVKIDGVWMIEWASFVRYDEAAKKHRPVKQYTELKGTVAEYEHEGEQRECWVGFTIK